MATVSGGTTSERFGFILRYKEQFGIAMLCKWLSVSRSGCYAWCERDISVRTQDDQYLLQKITTIYEKSESRYGGPKVFKSLVAQGIQVGQEKS